MLARFHRPLAELLLDFGDEVLDAVRAHKGIEVEDVRSALLAPLRSYVNNTEAEAAENTS